jgi:hypothetical protein
VAAGEVGAHVERLVRLWLGERSDAESFKSFTDRQSDERLVAVAAEVSIEEARSRLRRRDSRAEVVDV